MKKNLMIFCLLSCLFVVILSACVGSNTVHGPAPGTYVERPEIPDHIRPYASLGGARMHVSAMFPSYSDTNALSDMATDVIRGQVIDRRVDWINTELTMQEAADDFARILGRDPTEEEMLSRFSDYLGDGEWYDRDYVPFYVLKTIHSIMVLEVFQGNYFVGDVIEIAQHGGDYSSLSVTSSGFVPLEVDQDLVIFMRSWSHIGRPNVLLNPWQSVYFFPAAEDGGRVLSVDAELESIVESYFELDITINDLLQLSPQEDFAVSRSGEWQPVFLPPTEPQVRFVPEHELYPTYTPWPGSSSMPSNHMPVPSPMALPYEGFDSYAFPTSSPHIFLITPTPSS